jgi:phage baseplate assembly protein W
MNIDFPYHIAADGRTAPTGTDDHIRDMIEQVLFTNPGERVNRPGFGCGLLQLIFSPNSPELATATQFLIQGSLQQWLGELIQLDSVDVQSEDSTIRVTIAYTVRQTQQKEKAEFVQPI